MTPKQYRAALKALGLSQRAAGELLGVSLRTSHGYANGTTDVPKAVDGLLWLLVRSKESGSPALAKFVEQTLSKMG